MKEEKQNCEHFPEQTKCIKCKQYIEYIDVSGQQKTVQLDPPGIWDLKGTETTEFTKQLLRQERRLACQEMIEYMEEVEDKLYHANPMGAETYHGWNLALEAAEEYLKTL